MKNDTNTIALEYIEWCDAITSFDGWTDKQSILEWGKNTNWIIHQAGHVIEENKFYILLASKYNPQDDEDKFSEITKIPTTWIKKRKIITSLF